VDWEKEGKSKGTPCRHCTTQYIYDTITGLRARDVGINGQLSGTDPGGEAPQKTPKNKK